MTTTGIWRRGRGIWRLVLLSTCMAVFAAIAGACGADQPASTGAAQPAAAAAARAPGQGSSPDVVHSRHSATTTAPSSPAELTLQLQALLGQHSVLVADMMRGRLRGDPDFAQAANAALGKNTEALGALIRSLFGAQAQARFDSLWQTHVTALFNYARGLADHDDAVRRDAGTALVKYEGQLASFFSDASAGRLPRTAAEAALRMHVDQLLRQADRYAAKDYDGANRLYRVAYAHTFGLGKTLAASLVPAAAAVLETPAWTLRSELGRLLGEHVSLVVSAMRAGVVNAPDFAAAGEAVNGNTADLAGAVDTLFGAAAARRFQSLWADHVDALMAYTAGVVASDATRRDGALTKLGRFETELAAFLGSATGRRMDAGALAKAFLEHDQMLRREVDAYVGKDYATAHDIAYATYQQMFTLAGQLATAFGATVMTGVPAGAPNTGGGPAGSVRHAGH